MSVVTLYRYSNRGKAFPVVRRNQFTPFYLKRNQSMKLPNFQLRIEHELPKQISSQISQKNEWNYSPFVPYQKKNFTRIKSEVDKNKPKLQRKISFFKNSENMIQPKLSKKLVQSNKKLLKNCSGSVQFFERDLPEPISNKYRDAESRSFIKYLSKPKTTRIDVPKGSIFQDIQELVEGNRLVTTKKNILPPRKRFTVKFKPL